MTDTNPPSDIDDLDTVADDLRHHIAATGTHNFNTDTQGFIATTNVWTMTEAAEILAPRADAETVAKWSHDERARAVADIIGQMIRGALTVAPIRDELLAHNPDNG